MGGIVLRGRDPLQFQNIKLQLGAGWGVSKLTASTSIPCAVTEGRTCGRRLHCICSVGECTEGQAEGPVFMWQFQSCSVFSCRSTGIALHVASSQNMPARWLQEVGSR